MLGNIETLKVLIIGLAGFNFSKRIASKYAVFRKSGRLPVLIFLRLFGTGIMNKVINIYRTELISNHYRLYFNLYFKTIGRLEQMLNHRKQSQNYLYPVDYIRTRHLHDARELSNYASYFKNVSLYLKNVFQQDLYVRSGDTVSKNEIASSRQVGIRNDRKEGHAMTYKRMLSVTQLLNQVSHVSNPPIPLLLKMGEVELPMERSMIFGIASLLSPNTSLRKRGIDYPSFVRSSSLITPLLKGGEGGLFAALSGANMAKGIIREERGVIRSKPPYLSLRGEAEAISKIGASSISSKDKISDEAYPERDSLVVLFPQGCPELRDSSASPQNDRRRRNDKKQKAQNDKRRVWDDRLMVFSNQNYSGFLRKITDKYLQTTSVDISPGIILNTQKINNPALKIGANTFSVTDYPEAGNNSKNVNYHRQEKISALFNNIPRYLLPKRSNSLIYKSEIDFLPLAMTKRNVAMIEKHIVNKSTDLILRKPITQNTNTVSESKDHQHKENVILPKTAKDLTKDLKEKSVHEINMIADKVYKILEKRIAIEKDRRGWY